MMELLPLICRTVSVCLAVFVVIRMLEKRDRGKFSLLDLAVTVMIAEVAVTMIEDRSKAAADGLIPIALLLVLRQAAYRLFTHGRQTGAAAAKGVDAEFAVLGRPRQTTEEPPVDSFDTVRYEGLPLPLIMGGKVQDDNLMKLGQTRFWLKSRIRQEGVNEFKDVYFCSLDHLGRLFLDKRKR